MLIVGIHQCSLPGCDLTGEAYQFRHEIAPALPPPCRYCKQRDDVIMGEGGLPVCRSCITMCVRFVVQPEGIAPDLLETILRVHGDVVQLEQVSTRHGSQLRWTWSRQWPAAEGRRV